MLLDYTSDYVTENVTDVCCFLDQAEEGFSWQSSGSVGCESRETLLQMMSHLARVRSREAHMNAILEPLNQVSRNPRKHFFF